MAGSELQQHDRFGEVIEIIGGKPGRRIDIGAAATRCDRGGRRCGEVNRAIGGRREHGQLSSSAMWFGSVAGTG